MKTKSKTAAPPRWFVERKRAGDVTVTICVEARVWEAAIAEVMKMRGEQWQIGDFTVTNLTDGVRLVLDRAQGLTFTVRQAPADAPLTKWFVGQEVVHLIRYQPRRIIRVEKVTPSGMPVADGEMYRQDGGGRGRNNDRIEPATDKHRATLRHKALVERARTALWGIDQRRARFEGIPSEELEQIAEKLEAVVERLKEAK